MNLYEQKMPAYLAMSEADLVAEVMANGKAVTAWYEQTSADDDADQPENIKNAEDILRIANHVLSERFGYHVHFKGDFPF
jgi:hypothetical protein